MPLEKAVKEEIKEVIIIEQGLEKDQKACLSVEQPLVPEVVVEKENKESKLSTPGNKVTLAPIFEKATNKIEKFANNYNEDVNNTGMDYLIYLILKDLETKALTLDLDEAAKKLQNLENLIEKTFSKELNSGTILMRLIIDDTHTHFYSGNRLWKNGTCPICKTETMKNAVDLNAIRKAEKENDKMLLHISLQIDKEYFDQKKVPRRTYDV